MTPTLAVVFTLLAAAPAPEEVVAEPPLDDSFDGYTEPQHLELGMGFIGGVRDLTRAGYTFNSGTAESVAGAQALTAPFALAPYDRTVVYGLSWETRYVSQHVRFTVGVSKPFASFRMMDALFPTQVGGATLDVGTRSLSLWDVRFGLGTEYAFKYAAPFVDVLGDMQRIEASMTVDGHTAEYKAWTFGFVVRAGVRFHMGRGVYLAPMAEVGFGGPVRFGAGLQAGWVIPMG
ncbi:MAG: hypothetical protein JNK82_34190 [Myxococcaceae bacterium]|nr:hypothetical protein [Myxococcaceae bacterium]